ncbi:hypothetical protein ONZ43_g473 [Nemania bipapillata]|uniref:Uncharacterized protein n=1 Tax=Nemania bipapillata TaxID=110536 RepID=A0ACC2J847_9PEZI|nr:hypothetical protein ONZ43_g473 [Nemania bipapillata]
MIVPFTNFTLLFLGLLAHKATAGGCLSSIRDPDSDSDTPDNDVWVNCLNPEPEGGWACTQPGLSFPNLECIKADIMSCGVLGRGPTVFYSMGARTFQARQGLRDKLTPPGVMFNDVLGSQWWEPVMARLDFHLEQQDRQDYFRNLFAIAMAQLSFGEVYLATKSRISEANPPGDPGIFQNPLTLPNIWRQMELPNLMRNPAITSITHVAIDNNYQQTVDWRQGDDPNRFPLPDIDPNNPPPVAMRRRDVEACPFPPFSSGTPTPTSLLQTTLSTPVPTTSSQSSMITPAPSLSCELHNEDPDQGINQAFCLCNDSITLSPLPATAAQSESCAYTTIPVTTAFETVTRATMTWTSNCSACTLVGGIADSATCTRVSGCTPTAAPTPTIAAWVGNLSTIDIGDAEDGNGGKDLAMEMFTKLKGMCSSSGCKPDHAEMDNVETILADGEEPLKPAMYLQDAQYSSQDILEKMLSVGIGAWVSALNNEDLKLCKDVEYEADADATGSGCGTGPVPSSRLRRKVRRDTGELLWERGGLAQERRLAERCLDGCDAPLVCHYQGRICSAPNEITVVMAGDGNPYANHVNIGVTLDAVGDGFPCEEFAEAITAALVIIAPELLGPDAFEGYELEALCGIIEDPASALGQLGQLA